VQRQIIVLPNSELEGGDMRRRRTTTIKSKYEKSLEQRRETKYREKKHFLKNRSPSQSFDMPPPPPIFIQSSTRTTLISLDFQGFPNMQIVLEPVFVLVIEGGDNFRGISSLGQCGKSPYVGLSQNG
jgi:hypothetical protein